MKQTRIYKLLKRLFFKIIFSCYYKNKQRTRTYYFLKWVIENKDDDLLYDYPLNSKSKVVDIGGYLGFFSEKIVLLYNPFLYIFEPINKYYKFLKSKFIKNNKVNICNYGISDRNYLAKIYLSDDGTSLFKKNDKFEKIKLVDIATIVHKIGFIDLLSINIEGSEYQVVSKLIDTKLIKKVKFIQIQFHDFVPQAKRKRLEIIRKLLKTHKIKFSYPFVWESFELKK